jgi:hypothetical protein
MRRAATVFGMLLVFSIFLVSLSSAAVPGPGGPFSSAFRVQNMGTLDAHCSYTLYDSAGAVAFDTTTTPETIAPGGSMFVYTPSLAGLNAGVYSAVVSCDQPVAAVSNFSTPTSGASHNGINNPSNVWYAPGLYNNYFGYYSNVVVQNTTGSPANITLEIFAPGSTVPVATQTTPAPVPANASYAFDQTGLAGLNPNVAYSGKITGAGGAAVAPVVNIYGPGTSGQQLYSYNAFTAGTALTYTPVIMNNYFGYNTALTVQNLGASDAQINVEYGTGLSVPATIASNSSQVFYTPSSGLAPGTLTGAKITSTNAQPIVALVNESNVFNRAASYSSFATGGTEVRAPIVMKRYFDYNTSVTCQNVGSAATTMTLTYGGVAGTNTSPSIAQGQSHLFYQPADSLIPDGFIGSATITSSGSVPIVCVVNEDQNEGILASTAMDQLYAYDAVAP